MLDDKLTRPPAVCASAVVPRDELEPIFGGEGSRCRHLGGAIPLVRGLIYIPVTGGIRRGPFADHVPVANVVPAPPLDVAVWHDDKCEHLFYLCQPRIALADNEKPRPFGRGFLHCCGARICTSESSGYEPDVLLLHHPAIKVYATTHVRGVIDAIHGWKNSVSHRSSRVSVGVAAC